MSKSHLLNDVPVNPLLLLGNICGVFPPTYTMGEDSLDESDDRISGDTVSLLVASLFKPSEI